MRVAPRRDTEGRSRRNTCGRCPADRLNRALIIARSYYVRLASRQPPNPPSTMFHRIESTYFTTATINDWQNLLYRQSMIDIVMHSLGFLVENGRCQIYAFVIMPNHIHLIWHVCDSYKLSDLKYGLFSYTAHEFRRHLLESDSMELENYKSRLADRRYNFWIKSPFDIPTVSEPFLLQKLDYIHRNPSKAGLVNNPWEYKYSSASSYRAGRPEWEFLTLYRPQIAQRLR